MMEPREGTVIRAQGGFYTVREGDMQRLCTLPGRLKERLYAELDDGSRRRVYADPVAVGDRILYTPLDNNDGIVEDILPRTSKLSRMMAGPVSDIEQVIVANADQIALVASVREPKVNFRFLDRVLLLAEYGEIQPLILINKADMLDAQERADLSATLERIYGRLGYRWMLTSALTGEGVNALKTATTGKFTAFVGMSGTGKSSLLNAIAPSLNLRTQTVSEYTSRGKHTTSAVELYEFGDGTRIADTPGIREVGLWGIPYSDMDYYFIEMRPFLGKCKFSDCKHLLEPQCAVRNAVKGGDISIERYDSYCRLQAGTTRPVGFVPPSD